MLVCTLDVLIQLCRGRPFSRDPWPLKDIIILSVACGTKVA